MNDHYWYRLLARLDWLVTYRANFLHAPAGALTDEQCNDLEGAGVAAVETACGRTLSSAFIPGVFTRLYLPRCVRCCNALGLPPGAGSPRNDQACRDLLGMDR